MNRLKKIITTKQNLLSVFVTAGYPTINSLEKIILELEQSGVDLIEVGIPFSDPMADGKTIQDSSEIALANGMNLSVLTNQLKNIRNKTNIPLVLMGYFNPIYQYGVEKLLKFCQKNQIEGMMIPDISVEEYKRNYKVLFEAHNVSLIFIITPNTSKNRLIEIDNLSTTFIYLVSSTTITGSVSDFGEEHIIGFESIKSNQLKSPILVGFGIHNKSTFNTVCNYFNGAIIGSAFIRFVSKTNAKVNDFVKEILG